MDFKLSPGLGHTQCQDDPTCEGEKYILCFRDVAQDMTDSMNYLSCVDQLPQSAWPSKNAQCAAQSSVAAGDVEACFNGERAEQLLADARDYFWKRFPDSTFVPRLYLNNETYQGDSTEHPVDGLLQAFCETGIQAAACFVPTPTPAPTPSPPSPVPEGTCEFRHGYIAYDGSTYVGTTQAAYEDQCCDKCRATEGCGQALFKVSTGDCKMYTSDVAVKLDDYQRDYWVCTVQSAALV